MLKIVQHDGLNGEASISNGACICCSLSSGPRCCLYISVPMATQALPYGYGPSALLSMKLASADLLMDAYQRHQKGNTIPHLQPRDKGFGARLRPYAQIDKFGHANGR